MEKTCGKICIYLLRVHLKKRSVKDLFDDVSAFFFLIFFIKAYVVAAHFQQINAIQMGTHRMCLCKEVDKKYTGCNL